MINIAPLYPTPQHAAAAQAIVEIFSGHSAVDSVLLVGSCARGKAGPDSCLDVTILARPRVMAAQRDDLEALWQRRYPSDPVFQNLLAAGRFSQVDLDFSDGVFHQAEHGWTSGADEFELEVGNTLAYSAALWQCDAEGSYYQELRAQWLPYYNEALRRERLEMALRFCRNNLAHIPLYAPRGLYFQCFKRYYHAFEEFLQALFISRRVYPIAYDKWVQESVVDGLDLPDLYARLPHLLEIGRFESAEIVEKARELEELLNTYVLEAA